MTAEPSADKPHYFYGLGRRKTAVARVRLYSAAQEETTGETEEGGKPTAETTVEINGRPAREYLGQAKLAEVVTEPLRQVEMDGRFKVVAKVLGGGLTGQAGAVRLGVARALLAADPEYRSLLRQGGFLTRDPRAKERKKYGLKRARKAPQYTKR